jgi:hypothetical protein
MIAWPGRRQRSSRRRPPVRCLVSPNCPAPPVTSNTGFPSPFHIPFQFHPPPTSSSCGCKNAKSSPPTEGRARSLTVIGDVECNRVTMMSAARPDITRSRQGPRKLGRGGRMVIAASKLLRKLRELELAVLLVLARLEPSRLGLVVLGSRGREIPYMAG